MNWYDFIFSEERSDRMQRHLFFWLLWWLYFTASYFHYEQTGLRQIQFESWNLAFLIKSTLLLLIHVAACYYFIGILMPRYFFKAKYAALIFRLFALGLLVLFSSYFMHKTIFPLVNATFGNSPGISVQNIWWTSIASGLLSAPKIICAAAAIKLVKRWYSKQKEKERLEKEKLITELQLLKAQIHPEFLFSTLNNIFQMTQHGNKQKAAVLLLNLADILSYMLYDCENNHVPLEKEIKMIKDYLVLEKTRAGERLEMDMAIKGETRDRMIAPLLLFSFLENSFSFFTHKKSERNWINVEFVVELESITMKLIHGKSEENSMELVQEAAMGKAMRWLEFYYRDRYELKTTVAPDMRMIFLRIQLQESSEQKKHNNNYIRQEREYAAV